MRKIDSHENLFMRRVLAELRDAGVEPFVQLVQCFEDREEAMKCETALITEYGSLVAEAGPLCNFPHTGVPHRRVSTARRMRHARDSVEFYRLLSRNDAIRAGNAAMRVQLARLKLRPRHKVEISRLTARKLVICAKNSAIRAELAEIGLDDQLQAFRERYREWMV
jgi:hypothetical protein